MHSTVHEISSSGKLYILERLLETIYRTNPTDKVVVVSNFTSALTVIDQTILTPKKWSSISLDGTTVFLLSSKAGGCGLNLIGANRLIMFDLDWNPATDAQAMARIYRHQQTKPCYIYRLLTTGTVEEVILQRQIQKNNLDTISSRQQGNFNSFTDEEIRDCFTLKEDCTCDTKKKLGARWEDYSKLNMLLFFKT
jgi:SNF2 family DNA or RNA helicase